MTGTDQQLTESLRFQLSLLRLAVIPQAPESHEAPAVDAAAEIARLAEKVPVQKR